jgi:hypothetical protein
MENDEKSPNPFDQWRVEIEAELESERAELAADLTDHDRALQEVREANSRKAMVAAALARIAPRQLAGALSIRRHAFDQGQDAAAGVLSRITNSIAAHRRRITDLTQGLEQLNQISPQSDVSEAA